LENAELLEKSVIGLQKLLEIFQKRLAFSNLMVIHQVEEKDVADSIYIALENNVDLLKKNANG